MIENNKDDNNKEEAELDNTKSICYHPWVGLEITPQGDFRPCCKFSESLGKSFEEYENNEKLKLLKEQFSNNQRPEGCNRCWRDEDAGLPSKRQIDWKYRFNETEPSLENIQVLSLSFGNSCNLACRTCNSYSSSGWITESRKLSKQIPDLVIHGHKKFYKDMKFMEKIKSLKHVKHVEFPGGEPFLTGTKEHLDYLDILISMDPSQIELRYITNATIMPESEFWERWQRFKKVDIQLSIDGTGEKFEYLRHPAKWEEVDKNVDRYIKSSTDLKNISISISHTVSLMNVFYVPEFVLWCSEKKLSKPYLGLVSTPSMYSIRALPNNIKDTIRKKLDRFDFNEIVSDMYKEDLSDQFDQSLNYINSLDQQRNQKFSETFSEFYQLLEVKNK